MNKNNEHLGRVVFLHGLRTPLKDRRIHRLARAFHREGFCVVIPSYGYIPVLLSILMGWLDRRLAASMAVFIQENDILVGYSNGATLAYMISQKVQIGGVVLINAALEPDLAPNAPFTHVYFNRGDLVTKLARLIPFSLWGEMGATGYTGKRRDGVISIDQGNPPPMLPPLYGHGDIFKTEHLRPWSRWMAMFVALEVRSRRERNRA